MNTILTENFQLAFERKISSNDIEYMEIDPRRKNFLLNFIRNITTSGM
jgi:hypothetical protein